MFDVNYSVRVLSRYRFLVDRNYTLFYEIAVYLPTRKTQDLIAEKIKVFTRRHSLETKKLEILKQQQKAIQQLLLTGIVRV